jgi:hypothetical protein
MATLGKIWEGRGLERRNKKRHKCLVQSGVNLGKGEVVSSILTGSTRHDPDFHFIHYGEIYLAAAQRRALYFSRWRMRVKSLS